MEQLESIFRKRFYLLAACGGCVLFPLAWALAKHAISPREFAIGALLWWAGMFAGFVVLIRSHKKKAAEWRALQDPADKSAAANDRERCLRSIRSLKLLIVFMFLSLLLGLLGTRGQPLPLRLIGVAVNLSITGLLVNSMSQLKRRLK
jgi:ABC-type Fe3+-siderophore transport system permease subunit